MGLKLHPQTSVTQVQALGVSLVICKGPKGRDRSVSVKSGPQNENHRSIMMPYYFRFNRIYSVSLLKNDGALTPWE